jgi:membrane protease YdiL (CAAX protease family)
MLKDLLPIVEGMFILLLFHIGGGYYLFPTLYKIFPQTPSILLQIISSSAISSVIASIYMLVRCKFFPKINFNKTAFLSGLAGAVASWLIILIGSILFFGDSDPLIKQALELKSYNLYVLLFIIAIWNPIFEEALVRGYFFEIVLKKYNTLFAIVISSILFVIPHIIWDLNIYNIIFFFLISVVLTAVYIEGGLVASAITHSFINLYMTFLSAP